MKVAVIGNGSVGLATFRELQSINGIEEICLIGRNADKVRAEIEDYNDAFVLRGQMYPKISSGSYEKTAGADILIYTAGVAQKPGQSRLELVNENLKVTDDIFAQVNVYNKDAIVIAVSNPVDIITYEIVRITGRPSSRVIGTGTLLDTARCIKYLAGFLDISPKSLHLSVVGEHGDSSVFVASSLRILGMTLDEYMSTDVGTSITSDKEKIASIVRATAGKIICKKGATAYGVAAAVGRIVSAIVQDEYAILPVSSVLDGAYNLSDLAISVPCLIGRSGILRVMPLSMTAEEAAQFSVSAQIIRETMHHALESQQETTEQK